MSTRVGMWVGEELGAYGYEEKPWFRPDRLAAFRKEATARGLDARLALHDAVPATDEDLLLVHSAAHVERVRRLCALNEGALDHGPTFARASVERAATHVVGSVVDATRRILAGELKRAFVPIAGFHHAFRDEARSYCLYNDAAIAVKLARESGVATVGYVDVDVHQGDGVYRVFASDPGVVIADLHEDWTTLFPNTPEKPSEKPMPGGREDVGDGDARGTKLNIPLAPGTTDADFRAAWAEAEAFLDAKKPAFIVYVSGADGLDGDPMAHCKLSVDTLRFATQRVIALAERHAGGRLLVLGGGGYEMTNMVNGWCAVVETLLE
jgi:acetoin utilization protein AcuC